MMSTNNGNDNGNGNGETEGQQELVKNDPHDFQKAWMRHKKNILVLSNAGKPIYSRYGDESALSSTFGLLQAIQARMGDGLKAIKAGKHQFVFMLRGPIYLVVISCTDEPISYLEKQLEFVYAHILFHFTLSALLDTYRKNPGYDLRGLRRGTEAELRGLIYLAHYTPSILLEAIPSLTLPLETRAQCTDILYTVKQPNLIYAMLIAAGKLISFISPKKHPLKPADMLLLMNFVANARQLRSQETWTPLCLPEFNNTGFLHAYAAFLSENMCLLMLSAVESLEQFHYCSSQKLRIEREMEVQGITADVENAVAEPELVPAGCHAAAAIHVMYKSLRCDQYFETSVAGHAPLHQGKEARKQVIRRYSNARDKMFALHPGPSRTFWEAGVSQSVLAMTTPQFEIYATFHPYATSIQASTCCNRLVNWVNKEEKTLFPAKRSYW